MKKIFLFIAALFAMNAMAQDEYINGRFTINAAGDQVLFASGNLQYCWYYGDYSFAEHQYDIIGADNTNIGQDAYQGYIDLFGWGTYGYNEELGYSNEIKHSTVSADYATFSDWGQAVESMDYDGTWRTLTNAEWDYIFTTRANASSLYAKATVCGVKGMILLPDNWDLTAKPLTTTPISYDSNVFDATAWSAWETAGAVFLPNAGYRSGTTVNAPGSEGDYWTSTEYESNNKQAYHLYVPDGTNGMIIGHSNKYLGMAVRLVKEAVFHKVTIHALNCTVAVEPSGINLDSVLEGTILHLTVEPTYPYRFKEWENYDPATGLVVKSDTIVTARCALLWQVTLPECEHGHVEATYTATGVALTAEELMAIPQGTKIHFKAVPDEGYKFRKWNFTDGDDPEIDITINQDREISATFIDKNATWKVACVTDPEGAATVTCVTPGIDLNAVPDGAEITLTWTPAEGYKFRGMTGTMSGEITFSSESAITLRVTRNITLNLIFLQKTYTVRLQADDYSTIMPAPQREGERRAPMAFAGGRVVAYYAGTSEVAPTSVTHGTKLDIIAQAELGWSFVKWNHTTSIQKKQEVTITSDTIFIAYFKEAETYSLTMQDDGNGVVTIYNGTPGEEVYTTAAVPVIEGTPIILTAHPNIGYEFDHWDNYTAPVWDEDAEDWIVPTMTGNLTVKAYFRPKGAQPELAEGALSGIFSIGKDGRKVQFSKGTLQYIAGDGKTHKVADESIAETSSARRGTWQFAENQIDYIGDKNNQAAEDYNKPIDVFCYGASGYDNRYPWLKTTTVLRQDLDSTNYDFGVFNAISNGGNEPGLWRVLNQYEMTALLYTRNDYTHYYGYGRQLHGTVDDVTGLFLMPDGWVMPGELAKENITFLPLAVENFTTNKYTAAQWAILEQSGVVFIPAGGARYDMGSGTTMYAVGQAAYSQSSTYSEGGMAYAMGAMATVPGEFDGGTIIGPFPAGEGGCSVRLVRDVPAAPEGIETPSVGSKQEATKLIRNGQLLIIRDGKTYNALGVEIK